MRRKRCIYKRKGRENLRLSLPRIATSHHTPVIFPWYLDFSLPEFETAQKINGMFFGKRALEIQLSRTVQ